MGPLLCLILNKFNCCVAVYKVKVPYIECGTVLHIMQCQNFSK